MGSVVSDYCENDCVILHYWMFDGVLNYIKRQKKLI